MKTIVLDGYHLAQQHAAALKPQVKTLLEQGRKPVIAAILFQEDIGSALYTGLKREMAESFGIGYQVHEYSLSADIQPVLEKIAVLNQDPKITGIIIQKPWRNTWMRVRQAEAPSGKEQFAVWWQQLVTALNPEKDVDGLHPSTLAAIQDGTWQEQGKVLPATCKGVLALLERGCHTNHFFQYARDNNLKTVILGKSDLLGKPLHAYLQSKKCASEMIGSSELKERIEQKKFLKDADIIVSATGRSKLITADLVKEGAVIIDAGEPKADTDFSQLVGKVRAITPVPGGVGPMTVISLMENAVALVS